MSYINYSNLKEYIEINEWSVSFLFFCFLFTLSYFKNKFLYHRNKINIIHLIVYSIFLCSAFGYVILQQFSNSPFIVFVLFITFFIFMELINLLFYNLLGFQKNKETSISSNNLFLTYREIYTLFKTIFIYHYIIWIALYLTSFLPRLQIAIGIIIFIVFILNIKNVTKYIDEIDEFIDDITSGSQGFLF